jgi:hypothetical protein
MRQTTTTEKANEFKPFIDDFGPHRNGVGVVIQRGLGGHLKPCHTLNDGPLGIVYLAIVYLADRATDRNVPQGPVCSSVRQGVG